MSAKHNYKSKPGTIGRSIEKLVLKCKEDPMQFYILERALAEACGTRDETVYVGFNRTLVHETPGYKAAEAARSEFLARLDALRKAA